MIPTYQYIYPYEDVEEGLGYIELIDIGTIIPPGLPPNVKFNISSAMILHLYLKSVFAGLPTNDENMHLENYIGIYTSYIISGVD